MILLKSISVSGMKFAIIDGDLCAIAHTYAISGKDVIEVTQPDERGYREIKIVIIKDVGELSIDWIDGIYQIDNDKNIIVNVDYTNTKYLRGRIGTSLKWAEYAKDHIPKDAIILSNTTFDRSTYDQCGYGGFYLMLSE